ncbi:hypothetical protein [Actinomyces naeslundii]|uniref:hypothetical protein n=1 Tax=Actinomyces naeslundii TaxID=1655 RepID=UPI00096EDE12|nr:hypothetical protein [Actinomyces naeslundii]OMG41661.1 hypothetical protein BKH14_00315 [Actinomyces naeslundii]
MSGGTSHVPDHQHWKPAVPLWGVVYGRIGLGILEAIALGAVVAVWSALTDAGLVSDQVTGFAILATAVREVLDASSMRLTMRILRTNDMNGTQRTVAAIVCPAIGGALATMVFVPHALTHLTLLTWALFMLITCTLEQPWKTPMSYQEMRERGRRTRLMTRDHFAEEIADGRMTFRPIDDEGYYLDEDGNRIDD